MAVLPRINGSWVRDRLVVLLLGAAILIGAAQAALWTATKQTFWLDVDDVLAGLAAVACLPRVLQLRTRILAFLAVLALWLVAATAAPTLDGLLTAGQSVTLLRQVLVPVVLVVVGLVLREGEWLALGFIALGVAAVNAVYICVEAIWSQPINPLAFGDHEGISHIPGRAIPNYYAGQNPFTSHALTRAGGLFLNPPTAGISVALGTVLVLILVRRWWAWPLAALGVTATYLTYSKAGWVILIGGLLVALGRRVIGAFLTTVIALVLAVTIGIWFAVNPWWSSHFSGLSGGLHDALTHPLGHGFGHGGNLAPASAHPAWGESLAGIFFSALGWFGILVFLGVGVALYLRFVRTRSLPDLVLIALAMSALVVSLFAETASALTATVIWWLTVGYVLRDRIGGLDGRRRRRLLDQPVQSRP